MASESSFDADILIIGGGPAALSLATGLVRQQYTALIFDSGEYRNAEAKHMHNVIAHDHQPPSEFRQQARESIATRYEGIQFKDLKVESVRNLEKEGEGKGFEVTGEKGKKYRGRKLVLAIGVKDEMPSLSGYAELW